MTSEAPSCHGNVSNFHAKPHPAVADPGFAKGEGGANHGERAECEPKRGSGGGAPSGVQGLVGGQGAKPPEAKSFLYIFIQKSG